MRKELIFAAAALMLAACSNDESMDNWAGEIRLSSSLSVQETNTRAATNVQSEAFESGQDVDVYINEVTTGDQEVTTTYGTNGLLVYTTADNNGLTPPSPQYFPSSGNGVSIYAVYPSKTTSGSTFTVEDNQDIPANYKASDLMFGFAGTDDNRTIARTSATIPVNFKHLLSKVTIKLVSGTGSPTVTGAKVALLNVSPSTTFTIENGKASISAASGDKKNVTVTTNSLADGNSAIVIPQQLPEEFVQVTLADGGVLKGKLNSGQPNLAEGNEYIYTITVNLTGLTISSKIQPWTGNTDTGSAAMEDPNANGN